MLSARHCEKLQDRVSVFWGKVSTSAAGSGGRRSPQCPGDTVEAALPSLSTHPLQPSNKSLRCLLSLLLPGSSDHPPVISCEISPPLTLFCFRVNKYIKEETGAIGWVTSLSSFSLLHCAHTHPIPSCADNSRPPVLTRSICKGVACSAG